jgi:hypothetical protein
MKEATDNVFFSLMAMIAVNMLKTPFAINKTIPGIKKFVNGECLNGQS